MYLNHILLTSGIQLSTTSLWMQESGIPLRLRDMVMHELPPCSVAFM